MPLESVGTALFTDIFLLTVAFPVHVRLHTNCLTYHGSLAPKLFMSMMKLPSDSGGRPHALITFKCYTEANSEFRYTGVVLLVGIPMRVGNASADQTLDTYILIYFLKINNETNAFIIMVTPFNHWYCSLHCSKISEQLIITQFKKYGSKPYKVPLLEI